MYIGLARCDCNEVHPNRGYRRMVLFKEDFAACQNEFGEMVYRNQFPIRFPQATKKWGVVKFLVLFNQTFRDTKRILFNQRLDVRQGKTIQIAPNGILIDQEWYDSLQSNTMMNCHLAETVKLSPERKYHVKFEDVNLELDRLKLLG